MHYICSNSSSRLNSFSSSSLIPFTVPFAYSPPSSCVADTIRVRRGVNISRGDVGDFDRPILFLLGDGHMLVAPFVCELGVVGGPPKSGACGGVDARGGVQGRGESFSLGLRRVGVA